MGSSPETGAKAGITHVPQTSPFTHVLRDASAQFATCVYDSARSPGAHPVVGFEAVSALAPLGILSHYDFSSVRRVILEPCSRRTSLTYDPGVMVRAQVVSTDACLATVDERVAAPLSATAARTSADGTAVDTAPDTLSKFEQAYALLHAYMALTGDLAPDRLCWEIAGNASVQETFKVLCPDDNKKRNRAAGSPSDIRQSATILLFERLRRRSITFSARGLPALHAWLNAVCGSMCATAYRRISGKKVTALGGRAKTLIEEPAAPEDPEDLRPELDRLVVASGDPEAAMIVADARDGRTIAQAAAFHEIPERTYRQRRARVVALLRRLNEASNRRIGS